jgi:hypothetical protein
MRFMRHKITIHKSTKKGKEDEKGENRELKGGGG